MRMSMDTMFTLELLVVAVVIIIIVAGAVYIATRNRRTRRETGRKVGTADAPVGTAPEEPTSGSAERTAPRPTRVLQEHGLGNDGGNESARVLRRGVPGRAQQHRRAASWRR
jgi:hypothetical protein